MEAQSSAPFAAIAAARRPGCGPGVSVIFGSAIVSLEVGADVAK